MSAAQPLPSVQTRKGQVTEEAHSRPPRHRLPQPEPPRLGSGQCNDAYGAIQPLDTGCLSQSHRDLDRAIRIVALSHVHEPRELGAGHSAIVLAKKAELGAAERQDCRRLRHVLGNLLVVAPCSFATVTTANKKDVTQLP
eukprot:CAMPEP_0177619008 /NCGR_PEP_ID=MMETSP0419_2-20121207/25986_1 /TAXON_ID=582737 /ORGANISM="Tetraselmis sp., Strain GSL018" /LENGTH=139 /DNA_ID=CAMNT_0019118157 /DNA_START=319 /DNA_END=734 /DNA_ORIENTATION=+